jgi:hypothetical protein
MALTGYMRLCIVGGDLVLIFDMQEMVGVLEYWSIGVLECWSVEALEYWEKRKERGRGPLGRHAQPGMAGRRTRYAVTMRKQPQAGTLALPFEGGRRCKRGFLRNEPN